MRNGLLNMKNFATVFSRPHFKFSIYKESCRFIIGSFSELENILS